MAAEAMGERPGAMRPFNAEGRQDENERADLIRTSRLHRELGS
jgi:hypothetical protein